MLSIDSSAIVIFIIIWVLFLVLSKTFFNRLKGIMAEREANIRGNKESGEKMLQKYEQSINEIERSLKSAKAVSESTQEEFDKEAFKEKNRLLEEISKECKSQREKARKQLNEQIKSLKKELKSEAVILAEKIEEKLFH